MAQIELIDRLGALLGALKGSRLNGGALVQLAGSAFEEAVDRGNVWVTANQSTVTTQAGLSATTPALTLAALMGGGKRVKLWYASATSLVAAGAAAAVYGTMGGTGVSDPSSTTNATVRNLKTGAAALPGGVGAYSVATLPAAPVAINIMGAQTTAAITTSPVGSFFERWFNGAVWLAPGYNYSIQTSTASTLFCEYIFEVADL